MLSLKHQPWWPGSSHLRASTALLLQLHPKIPKLRAGGAASGEYALEASNAGLSTKGHLLPTWETWMEFLAPGWVHRHVKNKPEDERSFPPLSVCLSNKLIKQRFPTIKPFSYACIMYIHLPILKLAPFFVDNHVSRKLNICSLLPMLSLHRMQNSIQVFPVSVGTQVLDTSLKPPRVRTLTGGWD